MRQSSLPLFVLALLGGCPGPDKPVPVPEVPTCTDGIKNGKETDIDCGGPCKACDQGKACIITADCRSELCESMRCVLPATCTDSMKNGKETDIDCGGPCTKCTDGYACSTADDCVSGVCQDRVCVKPACADRIKNGDETDIDCGGSGCGKCEGKKACLQPTDCLSNVCKQKICAAVPTVSSIEPASGPTTGGVKLTLRGMDLLDTGEVPKVFFIAPLATCPGADCKEATDVAALSAMQMTLTLPSFPNRAGKVDVLVKEESGRQGLARDAFSYYYGTVLFGMKDNYGTGNRPTCVAAADFDRDGKLDLALTNENNSRISVLSAKGKFEGVSNYDVGTRPIFLAAADLSGDTYPDIVVANLTSATVSVLINDGAGSFKPKTDYSVGAGAAPSWVALGDVTGDNVLDIAVANRVAKTVSVLIGNGNGTFQLPATVGVSDGAYAVAIADLNGDKKGDLVVSNFGGFASVLIGNGNGTFQAAVNYPSGRQPIPLALADVNGDGKLDLMIGSSLDNELNLLMGNGNGTFQDRKIIAAVKGPTGIATADFNRDGILDLAVSSSMDNNAAVLIGKGDGTFQMAMNQAANDGPSFIVAADLNQDGKTDLAVSNLLAANVSIILNTSH